MSFANHTTAFEYLDLMFRKRQVSYCFNKGEDWRAHDETSVSKQDSGCNIDKGVAGLIRRHQGYLQCEHDIRGLNHMPCVLTQHLLV
jgi:hypothetical protein